MQDVAITTVDNPFNPLDDYEAWYGYDRAKGYNTPEYMARLLETSDQLSIHDQHKAIEEAIDRIVLHDPTGIYRKVTAY